MVYRASYRSVKAKGTYRNKNGINKCLELLGVRDREEQQKDIGFLSGDTHTYANILNYSTVYFRQMKTQLSYFSKKLNYLNQIR